MLGQLLFFLIFTAYAAVGNILDVTDLHRKLEEGEELGTLNKPFIFFHLEKTGGSTLRESFVHIYQQRNKLSMIPCKNLRCEIEAISLVTEEFLNISSCAVAFLGHFDPVLILNALWAIDQGHYGPVECHRGWSNLQKDIGIIPIGIMPPLLRAKEVQLLISNIDCTLILREPLRQRWSFYYFFEYKHKYQESFSEFFKAYSGHWLFSEFVYDKLQHGMVEEDYSVDNVKSLLDHCHTGVQEMYIDFYNDLRIAIPELPTAVHLAHTNPSTKNMDATEAARLDANSLTPIERISVAKLSRLDGQIWALARDLYQGDGKKRHSRKKGEECDLVCWDIQGNHWLPEPAVDGICQPCVYDEGGQIFARNENGDHGRGLHTQPPNTQPTTPPEPTKVVKTWNNTTKVRKQAHRGNRSIDLNKSAIFKSRMDWKKRLLDT